MSKSRSDYNKNPKSERVSKNPKSVWQNQILKAIFRDKIRFLYPLHTRSASYADPITNKEDRQL